MTMNWGQVRPKLGEWACPDHGIIQPDMTTVVPSCAEVSDAGTAVCQRAAGRTVEDGRKNLVHWLPGPAGCAEGHAKRALVSTWRSCRCTSTGGHEVWRCTVTGCRSVLVWPPIGVNPGCTGDRPN